MYTDDRLRAEIAKNIKKHRTLNDLTQEEIAERLSLAPNYYAMLERGERPFSLEKITQFCNLFDLKIEDIIEPDPEPGVTSEGHDQARQDMIIEISQSLDELSNNQLRLLARYMKDIVPFIS